MIYHWTKGPGIKADFFIHQGLITRINLSDTSRQWMSWEVISSVQDPQLEAAISSWMKDYAAGKNPEIQLPFSLDFLPSFTRSVLKQLCALSFGEAVSYSALAQSIHSPRSARAVGNACGRNPLPLLIPCHRVLAESNKLGGFSGGLRIKMKLLEHEQVSFKF